MAKHLHKKRLHNRQKIERIPCTKPLQQSSKPMRLNGKNTQMPKTLLASLAPKAQRSQKKPLRPICRKVKPSKPKGLQRRESRPPMSGKPSENSRTEMLALLTRTPKIFPVAQEILRMVTRVVSGHTTSIHVSGDFFLTVGLRGCSPFIMFRAPSHTQTTQRYTIFLACIYGDNSSWLVDRHITTNVFQQGRSHCCL